MAVVLDEELHKRVSASCLAAGLGNPEWNTSFMAALYENGVEMLDHEPTGKEWIQAPHAHSGRNAWRGVKYLVLSN